MTHETRKHSLLPWIDEEDIYELRRLPVSLTTLLAFLFSIAGALCLSSFIFRNSLVLMILWILLSNLEHTFRLFQASAKLKAVISGWAQKFKDVGMIPSSACSVPNSSASEYQLLHVIVIPNYKESLTVLTRTISFVASHVAAKTNYVLVLAMEQNEDGCLEKAQILESTFASKFHLLFISVHPNDIPGEFRGKGTNLKWACQKFDDYCIKAGVNANDVIFHIIDADALLPEFYVAEVERETRVQDSNGVGRTRIFVPIIMFGQNFCKVPFFIRAVDKFWSLAHLQNCASPRSINIPCACYSLPLLLVKSIDWWDTTVDAIGEDMHIFVKAFYNSNGLYRSTPIWFPVNLSNIHTVGYWDGLKNRFIQARRHLCGAPEALTSFQKTFSSKALLNSSFKEKYDRIYCFSCIFGAHLFASQVPLVYFGPAFASLWDPTFSSSVHATIISYSLIALVATLLVMSFLYEYLFWFTVKNGALDIPDPSKKNVGLSHPSYNPIIQFFDNISVLFSGMALLSVPSLSLNTDVIRLLIGRKPKKFEYIVSKKPVHVGEQPIDTEKLI